MELGSLADTIKHRGPIEDESVLAHISMQALRGLSYLHTSQKFIHGSICRNLEDEKKM